MNVKHYKRSNVLKHEVSPHPSLPTILGFFGQCICYNIAVPSIKNKLKRRKSSNLSSDILENVAISQVICAIQIKSLDHLEGVTLKKQHLEGLAPPQTAPLGDKQGLLTPQLFELQELTWIMLQQPHHASPERSHLALLNQPNNNNTHQINY